MDFEQILTALAGMWPGAGYILMGVGLLVVLAGIYVKMTPSPEDDEFLARLYDVPVLGQLLRALEAFSPVKRGDKPESFVAKKKK